MTDIYLISGFLGAGKTTLIQKLLKEAFKDKKVVLIENDFGEFSVDAALLRSGGVTVREINSGCICCSLFGDFVSAILDIAKNIQPDCIVIEPSGVGKLADVTKACSDSRIAPFAQVRRKITVVDIKHAKIYLKNFGEFFADQIKNAEVILLSRSEEYPEMIDGTVALIRKINAHAPILAKPWAQIAAGEILGEEDAQTISGKEAHPDENDRHCHAGHCHCGDHHHAEAGECHHDHAAEEVFDTVTIQTQRIFSQDELQARFAQIDQKGLGTVLRAKGILRSAAGYLNVQYLPGEILISDCAGAGDMLSFIGKDLNREALNGLFR